MRIGEILALKWEDINFDQIKTYIKYNEEDEELIG